MKRLLFIVILLSCIKVSGQTTVVNPRYSKPLWEVDLSYKAAFPVGDLSLRYGFTNGAGMDIYYKTKKNVFIGINANLFFGRNVKDVDFVNIFKDHNGYIFQDDGTPVFITASMRGTQLQGAFGKLFPVFKKHPQSAILAQLGIGFLQHKYLFSAPGVMQFNGAYLRGYDRLSNGLAISQMIGINNFGLNRMINFKLGIEVTEAFTKNRRYYDYATGGTDTKNYLDMLVALKCSWVLPIKANDSKETLYFK